MTKTNYLPRTPVERALLLALAAVVASLSVFAQAVYAQTLPQQPSNVVLVSPNSIKEGTPLDCIYELVQQGSPIDEALAGCDFGDKATPENPNDVGLSLGFGGGSSSTGTTVGSVSCSNGATPQVSGLIPNYPMPVSPQAPWDQGEGDRKDHITYKDLEEKADKAWENYYNAYQEYKNDSSPENLENLEEAQKAAKEAVDKRNSWQPGIVEAEPGDSDSTGGSGTATSQTDPNSAACWQAAEFVAQCNAVDWKEPHCQRVLNQMEGCDPTITDPMPGEEACGSESQPDPEEVERVAALVCGMEVNPSDPDQDPCAPVEVDAEVLRGVAAFEDDKGDFSPACGDLVALTGEEQCLSSGTHPSVIYAQFRGKDIEEIMKVAQEKLGGPGWVVPMVGPGSPGPGSGPKPETGETGPDPYLP